VPHGGPKTVKQDQRLAVTLHGAIDRVAPPDPGLGLHCSSLVSLAPVCVKFYKGARGALGMRG